MKKLIALFLSLFCVVANLYAQPINNPISFKDVPLMLYLQIGFLFVYVVLGLLFLLIFIFSPRQKLNLFFSLFNICLAAMIVNVAISEQGPNLMAVNLISRLIGANVLLFILYALDRMKPSFWWFTGFILFIDFPLNVILGDKYSFPAEIFHSVFTLICFWLAIVAFASKKSPDWLIGLIALAVVFINLRGLLFFFAKIQLGPDAITGITPFVITVCAVIFLALKYGRINTSLEQQLIQVQVLSTKNLESEKEKQQILAGQNEKLEQQVTQRTSELANSLAELKSTQAQLIQTEKMASLGELTAGIAHEIQNPLNFVNNFSEVNQELLIELKEEMANGNLHDAAAIADDVIDNQEKITHHGKRADVIVKGMLQHSRSGSGEMHSTDINKLVDEYLRLAYHGLRAKEKSFNAKLETDYHENVGAVNIVPQDIGRAILNVITNAFYAITEKSKTGSANYQPTVWVSTKRNSNVVSISVQDNGNGISQTIIDKIFQPFFTTKPTGQGTGLGLSLSYDIVKAHGGQLKVETKENEGSLFIISLPQS